MHEPFPIYNSDHFKAIDFSIEDGYISVLTANRKIPALQPF
jgi:hypothetical protein